MKLFSVALLVFWPDGRALRARRLRCRQPVVSTCCSSSVRQAQAGPPLKTFDFAAYVFRLLPAYAESAPESFAVQSCLGRVGEQDGKGLCLMIR